MKNNFFVARNKISWEDGFPFNSCTFKRTDDKIVRFPEGKTGALKPTKGSITYLNLSFRFFNGKSIDEDELSAYFDQHVEGYSVCPKSALRAVREILELDGYTYNVSIEDIGAEFVFPYGRAMPSLSLQLYSIVDSEYRYHYVLTTSLAMLETQAGYLEDQKDCDYTDTMFKDEGYLITEKKLTEFVKGMIRVYFDREFKEEEMLFQTPIMIMDDTIPEYQVKHKLTRGSCIKSDETDSDDRKNIRIGCIWLTDKEFESPLLKEIQGFINQED